MKKPTLVVIQSASDIGSAVAHRLKTEGLRPVLLEKASPGAIRRLMCFAGAVHTGRAELEGLHAHRCDTIEAALALTEQPDAIPLLTGADDGLALLGPALREALKQSGALVNARMRKKEVPPVQLGQARLTIGIGPGFSAGEQVDVVIESNWGENLGRVIRQGASEDYTGKHREVGGFGAQRYLYTPIAGKFTTEREIGMAVEAGEIVALVDDTPLRAEIGGLLRGLAYSGMQVKPGAKVVEIDPTADEANCRGIKERPRKIAEGVWQALIQAGMTPD